MRFTMLIKADESSEAGVLPDAQLVAAMGKYNDDLARAGVLLAAEGLHPSSRGARVRYAGGRRTVTEGPFAEAKDLVAGFWLIQAPSREAAIEWAKRCPGAVELRPLFELEDFPADPAEQPDGWRQEEQRFRDERGPAGGSYDAGARKPGTRRFMAFIKADRNTEAGGLPDEALLAAMGRLLEDMTRAGVLLAGEGLQPSARGARIGFAGGRRVVTDGPFPEAKELVAGYCLMQTASKAEAVDWASRMLEIHIRGTGVAEGEMEIREVFELEDFEREMRLRGGAGKEVNR